MNDEGISHNQKYATAATVAAFQDNLRSVRERINAAAKRAGRDARDIRLLPVSKTVPGDRIRLGIEAGITELGEKKVQEGYGKWEERGDSGVRWCVIVSLQTNEGKFVYRYVDEDKDL